MVLHIELIICPKRGSADGYQIVFETFLDDAWGLWRDGPVIVGVKSPVAVYLRAHGGLRSICGGVTQAKDSFRFVSAGCVVFIALPVPVALEDHGLLGVVYVGGRHSQIVEVIICCCVCAQAGDLPSEEGESAS